MKTRSVACVVVLLTTVALPMGCGSFQDSPAMRKARETSALSELKKFSTAQNILMVEEGRFACDLRELESLGGGLMNAGMVQASPRAASPRALNGYFYSQLQPRSDLQAGLLAYPAEIGRTGDKALMILIDEGRGPGPSEAHPVSGDNARLFFAPAKNLDLPFSHWPAESELVSDWREIRRRSPKEGLREAEQIFEDFQSGKIPEQDPVFGD
jgi:hypothetical protein